MHRQDKINIGRAFVKYHSKSASWLLLGNNEMTDTTALCVFINLDSGFFGAPIFKADSETISWEVDISPDVSVTGDKETFKWSWAKDGYISFDEYPINS